MKTLAEHNAERRAILQAGAESRPRPNGIKCPDCGGELWDTNPQMTLTSDPPQKNVHCPDCGYQGYRVA
jgi:DNA-directed RNA polymerase subunit RPC12/RpoP